MSTHRIELITNHPCTEESNGGEEVLGFVVVESDYAGACALAAAMFQNSDTDAQTWSVAEEEA
jgi:hypothetical protein